MHVRACARASVCVLGGGVKGREELIIIHSFFLFGFQICSQSKLRTIIITTHVETHII